jgi:RNA polymerase sigma-70 factor (ECF subfamily)
MNGMSSTANNTAREDVDAPLLQRARNGDLPAFETLVARYERRVYTLARRMTGNDQDAEDVTQQAFVSALQHLDGFRGDAKFQSWLLKIATHGALRLIRKRRGLPLTSLDAATEPDEDGAVPHPEYIADWRETPDAVARRHETQQVINAALDTLDEKHRTVFLLRDVEGLSVRETAAALGISEVNTKVRLLRARLQLREYLTRAFGDDATRLRHGHARPEGVHDA